ncbi:P-loop containing nucleoside triphosphate hydrolase protein [Mycena crocata]|nr:P-loop containing nucleoside triphosphate hydrolase protein [Mycena crocata]
MVDATSLKKRTVPLRVLSLGFCRTGTSSLRSALDILGYKNPHHMFAVLEDPAQIDLWMAAINAKFLRQGTPYGRKEWDSLVGHCEALTDCPSILFAKELIATYPEAKVILTLRDPDRWWQSYNASIAALARTKRASFAEWLDQRGPGRMLAFSRVVQTMMFGPLATDIPADEAKARMVAHYAEVRSLVPKDRLLEYNVGEGWERLCAFLGDDVPDVEFPHTNDAESFRKRGGMFATYIFLRWVAVRALMPTLGIVVLAAGVYAARSVHR